MFKLIVAMIAMSAIACLHVNNSYAQDVEPPKTSGEGDQILQEIARSSPPSSPPAGLGTSADQEGVLLPVTGGVISLGNSHRHSPPVLATQHNPVEEMLPVVALSAIASGGLLLGVSLAVRRQLQQRRRRWSNR